MEYLVHVETITSPVLSVCLFSQVPFPSLAFTSFLLTKLMNMWGGCGKEWGLQVIQAGPEVLEGSSGHRRPSCRDSWVEMGSLDKPQNP